MKLRQRVLQLAPFLRDIKLCFYPLDDFLLLAFATFKTPLSMFFRKWKNWHFARTKRLPYPECQCLKPPLFGGKLMDWQTCYKWRTSPSHIIYLAGLRLLLATSFMWHFAFRRSQLSIYFLKSDPKAFLLQPAASQGPHLWQIISGCGRKVGTNLANPIWNQ